MVRRFGVLILLSAAVFLSAQVLPAAAEEPAVDPTCSTLELNAGTCTSAGGENTGDGTDLFGTVLDPGDSTTATTFNGDTATSAPPFDNGLVFDQFGEVIGDLNCVITGGCGWATTSTEVEQTEPVTLDDIEHFTPHVGENVMEPEGWAVTGLHANFYSTVKRHIVEGELLGNPALVRYTPVAWHWNYGDGSSLESDAPGQSWDDLEQPEFTRTGTSHVFDQTGAREITLTVYFTAEYSFTGTDWVAIDGQVEAAADPIEATIGTAKTVLVSGTCEAGSEAPGC